MVNTSDEDWEDQVKAIFDEHKPKSFFDPIAGDFGSKMVGLMPNGSTTYNYGGLGGRAYNMGIGDLIFRGKTLTGFWLTRDLQVSPERTQKIITRSFENLAKGVIKTPVHKKFKQEEIVEALAY